MDLVGDPLAHDFDSKDHAIEHWVSRAANGGPNHEVGTCEADVLGREKSRARAATKMAFRTRGSSWTSGQGTARRIDHLQGDARIRRKLAPDAGHVDLGGKRIGEDAGGDTDCRRRRSPNVVSQSVLLNGESARRAVAPRWIAACQGSRQEWKRDGRSHEWQRQGTGVTRMPHVRAARQLRRPQHSRGCARR